MHTSRASIVFVCSALALACAHASGDRDTGSASDSSGSSGSPLAVAPEADAAAALATLERRLQAADHVEFRYAIESEGEVDSQLEGTMTWTRGGAIELLATGEFAGVAQELALRGDAEQLAALASGEPHWTGARPEALIEAVALGFTRQGLLHNLAMLTAGQPPDHAEGGADAWLGVVDPTLSTDEDGRQAIAFRITVEGQDVGDATLVLDAEGLPVERRQTVNFPEGQMRVIERYADVSVGE